MVTPSIAPVDLEFVVQDSGIARILDVLGTITALDLMSEVNPIKPSPRRRSIWLGILAAIITFAGASALLESGVVIAGRVWAASVGAQENLTEHLYGVGSGWMALLAIRILSFTLAGFVGAWVAPSRARSALVVLAITSLVVTFFEQLPLSLAYSIWWLVLWSVSAPVFTYIGVNMAWWYERQT